MEERGAGQAEDSSTQAALVDKKADRAIGNSETAVMSTRLHLWIMSSTWRHTLMIRQLSMV